MLSAKPMRLSQKAMKDLLDRVSPSAPSMKLPTMQEIKDHFLMSSLRRKVGI